MVPARSEPRPPPGRTRWITTGAAALALLAGGCADRTPTAPALEDAPAPDAPAPPLRKAASPSGTVLGQVSLPVTDRTGGAASVATSIQLPTADEGVAAIRITGTVQVEINPECTGCASPFVGEWGPGGSYNNGYRVFFDIVMPDGRTLVGSGHPVPGDPARTEITSRSYPGGRIVRVWRKGADVKEWFEDRQMAIDKHVVTGGAQTFTVKTLGPATVSASRRYVQSPADTVTFTAGASGGALTAAYWRFVAGDTLPQPGGLHSGTWISGADCEGDTECRWSPRVSGRMYVAGATIDGLYWGGEYAASPVIWVGKEPPSCSAPGPLSSADGPRLAAAGTEDACAPEERAELVLECTGEVVQADGSVVQEENRVTRGRNLSCSARAEPEGEMEILGWRFVGEGFLYPDVEAGDFEITEPAWDGEMAMSGTVKVQARVNGAEQFAEAAIAVAAREAFMSKRVAVQIRRGTLGDLPERARPRNPPRRDEDLGRAIPTVVAMGYDPEQDADALTRIVRVIQDEGPNHGAVYLKEIPLQATATVVIHPAMTVGSSFYRAQARDSNVAFGAPPCVQSSWNHYVQLIELHEGLGGNADSHIGQLQAALNPMSAEAVEHVVGRADHLAAMADAWQELLRPVWEEAIRQSSNEVFHSLPGGNIKFGCKFNFDVRM